MKQLLLLSLLLVSHTIWANSALEEGIRLVNQKEYDQAQQILQQESDAGNANATFWLAIAQYRNSQHFEAGKTFRKAAEMGDPWAMGVLAGKELDINSPCNYLGWPCNKSWAEKAFIEWEKQARNGSGKAILALRVNKSYFWEYIPYYRTYNTEKIYYDAFLKGSNYAILKMGSWVSEDKYIHYLKMAANKGYAPAMVSLYYYMETIGVEEAEKWINKAIQLGYAQAAKTRYFTYSQGFKRHDGSILIAPDVKKAYYYNRLVGILGGDEKSSDLITSKAVVKDSMLVFDENGEPMFEILVTEEEQAELDKQAEEFAKDIKPNMFLDETSMDLFNFN